MFSLCPRAEPARGSAPGSQRAAAFGHLGRGVVRAAGAEVRRAYDGSHRLNLRRLAAVEPVGLGTQHGRDFYGFGVYGICNIGSRCGCCISPKRNRRTSAGLKGHSQNRGKHYGPFLRARIPQVTRKNMRCYVQFVTDNCYFVAFKL